MMNYLDIQATAKSISKHFNRDIKLISDYKNNSINVFVDRECVTKVCLEKITVYEACELLIGFLANKIKE